MDSPDSKNSLESLQGRIGYRFRDPGLLQRALTHPSCLQEHPEFGESNQRLEFLGDAVLQLVVTEALFELYPSEREGPLSKRRAILANGPFLAGLAREIGLDSCLQVSAGEEAAGGRQRSAALGDAFEALIGAIHADSDLESARRVLLGLYGSLPDRLGGKHEADNPKGQLQEMIQPVHGNTALRYGVTRAEGPDHERRFEVTVHLHDRLLGTGQGTSKKLAEEAAAREALEVLRRGD